jgi:hypothetical protein
MQLGLRNYAFIMPIEISCIKFNNNEINTLPRYDTAQNYRILHKVVERFPNITSEFRTTSIFKSSAKENSGSNKTRRYIRDLSLSRMSFVLNTTVHVLSV